MLRGRRRSGIHFLLGARYRRLQRPRWLRYCPRCVVADREEYGETYWHRVHQVMGVEVCPLHGTWLRDSAVPTRSVQSARDLRTAEEAVSHVEVHRVHLSEPGAAHMMALAHNAQWLLDYPEIKSDPESVRRRYRILLAERGLATYAGRIRAGALKGAFRHVFPLEWLSRLEGEEDGLRSGRAARAVVRRERGTAPPLHHLLFMQFLGHTTESFFRMPAHPEYFGVVPWPCLNPATSHYQELTIQ